jgi:hypothetical protein
MSLRGAKRRSNPMRGKLRTGGHAERERERSSLLQVPVVAAAPAAEQPDQSCAASRDARSHEARDAMDDAIRRMIEAAYT